MSCISFTLPGKREKTNFWNKTCTSHKFRKFELRNLTFSKEGKIANFGTEQTQISDPGDLYWRSPSSSSSKLTRNDDSPKMMILSFRALRMLKFKNDDFQKHLFEVPGIFMWKRKLRFRLAKTFEK